MSDCYEITHAIRNNLQVIQGIILCSGSTQEHIKLVNQQINAIVDKLDNCDRNKHICQHCSYKNDTDD